MKVHVIPVRPKRAYLRIHRVDKTAQRHIQKTHGKVQLVAADPQDLPADLRQSLRCLLICFICYILCHITVHISSSSQDTAGASHS